MAVDILQTKDLNKIYGELRKKSSTKALSLVGLTSEKTIKAVEKARQNRQLMAYGKPALPVKTFAKDYAIREFLVDDKGVIRTVSKEASAVVRFTRFRTENPVGAICITSKRKKQFVRNADRWSPAWNGSDIPSLSFSCVARFFYGQKFLDERDPVQISMLGAGALVGNLVLVDFTQDIRKSGGKSATGECPSPSPGPGFSLLKSDFGVDAGGRTVVEYTWHRPCSMLLRSKGKNAKSYLFGQDEGTYFGCELATRPTSVDSAFEHLVPKGARGKEYKRQGEWFAVPVKDEHVPEVSPTVIEFSKIVLPKPTATSNSHELITSTSKMGRLDMKTGTVYAKGLWRMEHPDHGKLQPDPANPHKWYTFYENNALRSFSEEGVD